MNRFSRLLGEFSRKKSEAKLTQQLNKSSKAPEANANGTSGYLIKEGKNAGKVLKHLKTCLLYTSPSPRDGLLSRMPSSA